MLHGVWGTHEKCVRPAIGKGLVQWVVCKAGIQGATAALARSSPRWSVIPGGRHPSNLTEPVAAWVFGLAEGHWEASSLSCRRMRDSGLQRISPCQDLYVLQDFGSSSLAWWWKPVFFFTSRVLTLREGIFNSCINCTFVRWWGILYTNDLFSMQLTLTNFSFLGMMDQRGRHG